MEYCAHVPRNLHNTSNTRAPRIWWGHLPWSGPGEPGGLNCGQSVEPGCLPMSADSGEPHVQTIRIYRELPAETAWHCHREAQLYSLSCGIMTVETKRGSMAMPAGRVGWIPALQEHRARTFGTAIGWSTYFPPDLATRLPSEPCVLQNSELVEALVRRIATWPQERLRSEPYHRIVQVLIDEL